MYQNPKSKLFREACSKNLEFLPKLLFAFPKYISSSATDFSLKKWRSINSFLHDFVIF